MIFSSKLCSTLVPHHKKIYMCPSHKYRFIFFMVKNKHRAEFRADFHMVCCQSFRILRGPYTSRGEIFYYGVQKHIYFLVMCKGVKQNDSKKCFLNFYPRTSKNPKKQFCYFFVFLSKRRAEFWTDYHAFFCNRFKILTANVLSAHFFRFLHRDFKNSFKMACFWYPVLFWHPAANSCEFFEVLVQKSKKVSR